MAASFASSPDSERSASLSAPSGAPGPAGPPPAPGPSTTGAPGGAGTYGASGSPALPDSSGPPGPFVPSVASGRAVPSPSSVPAGEADAPGAPVRVPVSARPPGSVSAGQPAAGAAAGDTPGGSARRSLRPHLTELRLSAFAGHRRAGFPLGPVTLLAGPSGAGKTSALRAYEALARLGGGAPLDEVFQDPGACVPERARPDAQQRRGFRIGCTADGPEGPVLLDVAVQAEPELRIVGERLTARGVVLLETALRDPARRAVQAAWHTAGSAPVTRAPLPDDRLGTALLPLRVAGKTDGQRRVLAAAEQMVVALRSVFTCDPLPERMRAPVQHGPGRLFGTCHNLADVLWRTRAECGRRHAQFVEAVAAGCAGPVADVLAEPAGPGTLRALLDRGDGFRTDFARLGDGELRYAALALVLLTGPGVLEVDPPGEVPAALQALTVLTDGFDRQVDVGQRRALLRLAERSARDGHIRFLGAVSDASWAAGEPAVTVVHLKP